MYSYEDRMRAVELYIKLGKRVRATIRQSRGAMSSWARQTVLMGLRRRISLTDVAPTSCLVLHRMQE